MYLYNIMFVPFQVSTTNINNEYKLKNSFNYFRQSSFFILDSRKPVHLQAAAEVEAQKRVNMAESREDVLNIFRYMREKIVERKEYLKEKIRERCREMVGKRLMSYGKSFGKSISIIRGNDGFLNIYI